MCQGLGCCQCIYYNHCGDCAGLSLGLLCCSCWVCPPQALEHLRFPGVCRCQSNEGCGYNCFSVGVYYCAPQYLREYSIWKSIGEKRGLIYDLFITQQAVVQRELRGPESNRNLYWSIQFMFYDKYLPLVSIKTFKIINRWSYNERADSHIMRISYDLYRWCIIK